MMKFLLRERGSLLRWKFSMREDLCFAITVSLLVTMFQLVVGYTRKQLRTTMIVGNNQLWLMKHLLNKHGSNMVGRLQL